MNRCLKKCGIYIVINMCINLYIYVFIYIYIYAYIELFHIILFIVCNLLITRTHTNLFLWVPATTLLYLTRVGPLSTPSYITHVPRYRYTLPTPYPHSTHTLPIPYPHSTHTLPTPRHIFSTLTVNCTLLYIF